MVTKVDTKDVYLDLQNKLLTAFFESGQKLKPSELSSPYARSPNTIREVLLRLAGEGLLDFEDQRGFRTPPHSKEILHDLTLFRIRLEQDCAELSIKNGGLEWEARLTAAHHKLWHIEDRIKTTGAVGPVVNVWCAAEWELHDTLGSACGSQVMRDTFRTIYNRFRQQIVIRDQRFGFFEDNIAEHQRIVDAALARDVEQCRQMIYDHLAKNLLPNSG